MDDKCAWRLAYYDRLVEEQQLIVLPCKLGETVYKVCMKKFDRDGYGMSWFEDWGITQIPFSLKLYDEIGKTVFLSRAEAEAEVSKRKHGSLAQSVRASAS